MKKVFLLAITIILCFVFLTECSTKNVNLSDVMKKINTDFNLSLNIHNSAEVLRRYYNIDETDVKQYVIGMDSDNIISTEIVFVEATDSDAALKVEDALITRYNTIVDEYLLYAPEKLGVIQGCKVTKDNNYVTMIISDNASAILGVYYDFFK